MKDKTAKNTAHSTKHASTSLSDQKGMTTFFPPVKGSEMPFFNPPMIQAKLSVAAPNSKLEQEADQMADHVMRKPQIQNKEKQEEEGKNLIQRKSNGTSVPKITPNLQSGIQSLQGGGQALSNSERNFFEPKFKQDFSKVRVHNDAKASKMAESIQARAFTYGHNVVFRKGEYNSGLEGKKLMAHELTHVVQQKPDHKIYRKETKVKTHNFKPPGTAVVDLKSQGIDLFESHNVEKLDIYQINSSYHGKWGKLTFTYVGGKTVSLGVKGYRKFQVKLATGSWSPVLHFADRISNVTMRLKPSGELEFEGVPRSVLDLDSNSTGPQIHRFQITGGKWKRKAITDYSTKKARRSEMSVGNSILKSGRLGGGIELIEEAFRKRIIHDKLGPDITSEPKGTVRQNELADEYGKLIAAAVIALSSGKEVAKALPAQTLFLNKLYKKGSPFTTKDARLLVLNGYIKQLLSNGNVNLLLKMLPALQQQVSTIAGAQIYLIHKEHLKLRKIAEAELSAGNRTNALLLYRFGAAVSLSGETTLLKGQKRGNKFIVTTPTNPIELDLEMEGVTRDYDGLSSHDAKVAEKRADQIVFSNKWQVEAKKLKIFTPQQLAQVPPTAEMMQSYFSAKYNGQIPAKFIELRNELKEYMEIAFLHTVINVPDSLKVWKSQELPKSTDDRWAGDCGVMTRAVLHMLNGVAGILFMPIVSAGHIRLLVLASDQKEGLIESNNYIRPLQKGRTLNQRVQRTIGKFGRLHVHHNIPEPVSIGSGVKSATASDIDIDATFDASEKAATTKLPTINPALSATGDQLRPIIFRYDDFARRRILFIVEWGKDYSDASKSKKEAFEKKRKAFAIEQKKLESDLKGVSTKSAKMRKFIKELRTKIRKGENFLSGKENTVLIIYMNGQPSL